MPYIDVDINIDEFVDSCSSRDIKELIEYLRDNKHLPDAEDENEEETEFFNIPDEEWYDVLKKLAGLRLQMSLEDIETVKQIIKKY
jgi:hypothetical protein